MNKIRVKCSGTAMVPDVDALNAGLRRFIGRMWVQPKYGWEACEDAVEVKALPEYVRAVKEGDLLPADKETADFCKVSFESENV